MPDAPAPVRMLSIADLQRKLGNLSRTSVWTLRRLPGFPVPIRLGMAQRYVEAEVDRWLLSQPRTAAQTGEDTPSSTNGPAPDQRDRGRDRGCLRRREETNRRSNRTCRPARWPLRG